MRIDFLGLEAFLSIANRRSFNQAAGHLNLSQTALSHRLKKLEDSLGVKLFTRTTREVTLTSAGLELYPTAQRIVDELKASFDLLRTLGEGRLDQLAIGCLPTVATHHLPRVLQLFEQTHPGVGVRIFDNSASEIIELVRNGTIEFALTIVSTDSWDLEIKPIVKEPFVLVCPKDHPLAQKGRAKWADLEGQSLVRISTQTGNRMLIDDVLKGRQESLRWRYEVQHVATAIGLVQAGIALTVVPRLGVHLGDEPGLAAVTLQNPSIVRTLGIVKLRERTLSPLAYDLSQLITKQLRQMRPAPEVR